MKKRILVVEDNSDMLLAYSRIFRSEKDIELECCERGEDALEKIPDFKPHLVMVDISLPGMNGFELTSRIREKFSTIKILIVTGHDKDRYYDQAIKLGADDLISKDIGLEIIDKCRALL